MPITCFAASHGLLPPSLRRIPPSPGQSLRARPGSGIFGGGFFGGGGDPFLQLNHTEGPVAPALDQIAGQLPEGLIGIVGEGQGEAFTTAGLRWSSSFNKPAAAALRWRGSGGRSPPASQTASNTSQLQAGHVVAVAAEDDVGASPACGGDGYSSGAACLGHDLRFPLNIFRFGVEQVVESAPLVEN